MEVRVFKKKRTKYMAIVVCDPLTFKKTLDEKNLYINWSRCRVFEYISVFRCFKCGGFNHHAEKCDREAKCLKCCGNDHKREDCESDIMKCTNCVEVNSKFNLNLNT